MGRVFGCLHVLTQIHTHTQASDLDLDTQTPVQKKKKKTHNKRQLDLPALLFIYTFICTFFLNIFFWCFCSFCFCCCCCCCCWLFTSVEHFLRLVVVVITVVRLCFFFLFLLLFLWNIVCRRSLHHTSTDFGQQTFPTLFLNLLLLSYVIFVDVVVLAVCSLAAIMQWSGSTSRIFTMSSTRPLCLCAMFSRWSKIKFDFESITRAIRLLLLMPIEIHVKR